ncbi:Non-specific lipid-transfer protein [Fusarium oxysporum f. sp. albedinis]|nr:Non-specific lipid-transfer protein [Fusarium oxysporum f. sp. albedinis]
MGAIPGRIEKPQQVSSVPLTTTTGSEDTTTTLAEVSTSATLTVDEGTTVKLLTTVAEESVTTSVAEATTTSFPPIITNRVAFRTDNYETLEIWLQTYNTNNHLTSDKSIALGHATFDLEPGTSCLSATSPNGSQLFAQISFPNSNKYTFIFTTKKNVDNLSWYDFITYSESADGYLDCESGTSHTPIYWYYSDDVKLFYMEGSSTLFDYPSVKFKFVIGDA